jgi:hypothetical protein
MIGCWSSILKAWACRRRGWAAFNELITNVRSKIDGEGELFAPNFLKSAVAGTVAGATSARADSTPDAPPRDPCGSVYEQPPKQSGNDRNLIVIVSDTFRHDNLACYGPKWLEKLETPNLGRFAEKAVVFENAYAEGMPTIVIRRTLYTGRRVIPSYYFPQHETVQPPGWHQLYNEDVTMAETLLEAGHVNTLISSLYHQFKPGMPNATNPPA